MENNRKKLLINIFLNLIIIVSSIITLVYWVNNPELTEMQVAIKLWYIILIVLIAAFKKVIGTLNK